MTMESLREDILEILNGIVDPCSAATALPAGLVDMGLIRAITLEGSSPGQIECSITLCVTHAFCMMTAVFVHEIQSRLASDARISEVQILLDHATVWTEELMSPQYRDRLERWRRERGTRLGSAGEAVRGCPAERPEARP